MPKNRRHFSPVEVRWLRTILRFPMRKLQSATIDMMARHVGCSASEIRAELARMRRRRDKPPSRTDTVLVDNTYFENGLLYSEALEVYAACVGSDGADGRRRSGTISTLSHPSQA